MKVNSDMRRPNPTNSPMIVDEFQGLVVPPHWSASKRQQMAEIRISAPPKSMCWSLTFNGKDRSLSASPLSLRKTRTRKKTGPPTGTLLFGASVWKVRSENKEYTYIQKHHLQLTPLVKAPPKTGPKHVARPNTLTTMLRCIGRLARGTVYPTIPRAP